MKRLEIENETGISNSKTLKAQSPTHKIAAKIEWTFWAMHNGYM